MLAPGDFYFGRGRMRIHTLLGSCVAITMWHPVRRIGGMCHYLLPSRGNNRRLAQGYYAEEAVEFFLRAIAREDTRPGEYEVKLFGGGNMFKSLAHAAGSVSVSESNIEIGRRLLRAHGFRIKAADLGGAHHRRLYLELWSGDVWVQHGSGTRAARD